MKNLRIPTVCASLALLLALHGRAEAAAAKSEIKGAAILDHVLSCSAVGGPAKVAREIAAFVERTQVDELMIASSIYDHAARKRSLTITAEAMREVAVAA